MYQVLLVHQLVQIHLFLLLRLGNQWHQESQELRDCPRVLVVLVGLGFLELQLVQQVLLYRVAQKVLIFKCVKSILLQK